MVYSQVGDTDTSYFDSEGYPCEKLEAEYYKMYFQESTERIILQKTFYLNHILRSTTYFQNEKLSKKVDSSQFFYTNGNLNYTTYFDKNGNPKLLKQFYSNGKIKRIETYKNGQFVRGKKFDESGKRERFTKLQRMPAYKGGYKSMIAYLNKNISYPPQAKELNFHGTVIVSFIVTKEGSVLHPEIEKSAHPMLDKEALRVVKSMKHWRPGTIDEKKINSRISIPITFHEQ
jgi:protein TonB